MFTGMAILLLGCLTIVPGLLMASQERGITKIRKTAEHFGMEDYNPENFHALVIGINRYSELEDLQTAVADAKAVAASLKNIYGFGSVEMLLDEQATRSGILQKMKSLREKLTERDSLLIYYAGHGRLEEGSNVGSWVPTDGNLDDNFNDIANSRFVNDYLKKLKVRHLLLLSDSCFSGSLVRGQNTGPPDASIQRRYTKPSRWVMTSGDDNPVADDAGNGHSPFCNRIIQFLRSESPVFDVHDLYAYVKNLRSDPLLRALDTTAHQPGGSFVFIRKNADDMELAHLTSKIEQVVAQSPKPAETYLTPTPATPEIANQKTNVFSFTSPEAGILTIQDKALQLAEMPELALAPGKYPFTLQVPEKRRLIYGMLEVLLVDDETAAALFGATEPIFKPRHVQAALQGSPVKYRIGITSQGRKKVVAKYTLSLRKFY